MATLMDGLHRLGITMDAKRIGIKRSLYAVLVQDPQDAPDTRPPAIIILACRPAIVKRDNIVFLDRIRPADMVRPPMLRIRNLSPGFQIPCQSDGHSGVVWPPNFDLFCLRINVVEIIVHRHHGSKPPSKRAILLTASLYGNHAIVSNNGISRWRQNDITTFRGST